MSELLTDREVAQKLGMAPASLRRWRVNGQGPRFIKLGRPQAPGAPVRYRQEDLDEWLSSMPSGGAQAVHASVAG